MKKYLVVLAALFSLPAFATNGLMPFGTGSKGKSLGGNETILLDDAYTGANNPAASVFGKGQFDVELELLSISPSIQRSGTVTLAETASSDTLKTIPALTYTSGLSENMAWGISLYGIGGSGVKYDGYPMNCGSGSANVFCGPTALNSMEVVAKLSQLVLAPNIGYKLNEDHALGLSLLVAQQTIEVAGLEGVAAQNKSSDSANFTGKGPDTTTGFGFKLGWIGMLSDDFRLGFTYQSKIDMAPFENYKGLLAEKGNGDIPSTYALGGAYKIGADELVFEFKQINNSESATLSNVNQATTQFGTDTGPGFGFDDQLVIKLGYNLRGEREHRFGINYGKAVVDEKDVSLAFLAPAVGELHLSYGSSYQMGEGQELTYVLWYLMPNSVEGDTNTFVTGSNGKVSLSQMALAVAYAWEM